MPSRSTYSVIRTPVLLVATSEFVVFLAAGLLASFVLATNGPFAERSLPDGAVMQGVTLASLTVLSFLSMGLYQFHQRIEYRDVVARVLVGILIASVGLAVVYFLIPALNPGLTQLAVVYVLSIIPILLMRHFVLSHVDENIFRRNILILGSGECAAAITALRRRADRRGFKIVGAVPVDGQELSVDTGKVIVSDKPLVEIAREYKVDDIIIAMDNRRGALPIRELLRCKLSGIDVLDLLEFLERESGKIRADLVSPSWLIFSSGFRVTRMRKFLKRLLDIFVSVVGLLVVWPILLAVSLAIWIESGFSGPILYRQVRVGRNGELFELLKFRSMDVDAESDGGAVWARENDSRVTRVGRVIRKFRIDEFPQLLNVLRGEMSIVGPRPERPEFTEKLKKTVPYYDERHTLKPGITGWAQLKYSYGSSTRDATEKLHYDLYYVKNHGLILDIAIMIQTIEVMFWGKGAR